MSITIDRDVETAAALLQSTFEVSRLVSIASALADVAPVLWGRHGREQVAPALLVVPTSPVEKSPTASSQ